MSNLAEYTTEDGLGIIKDDKDKVLSYVAVVTFIHFLLSSDITVNQLFEAFTLGHRSAGYAAESEEGIIKVSEPATAAHARLLVDNFLLQPADLEESATCSAGGTPDEQP